MRQKKFRFWDGKKMNLLHLDDWTFFDGEICHRNAPLYPVMEFIGLKDRKKNEIYEEDILEYQTMNGPKFIGPVCWGRYQFYKGEMVTWIAKPIALIPESFKKSILHDCEIVGNIYENPELLQTN